MKRPTRHLSILLAVLVTCLLTACSTPESKVESFNKRGHAMLQKGEFVKARLEFQNALQINPSAVPSLFGLAQVSERTRDWPSAYLLLSKVVELQPGHLEAVVKLGKLQLAAGQLDKALASSEAAESLDARNADVLALRAAVFLKLGAPAKAVMLAKESLAVAPHQVDALVVLATERMQAADTDAAVSFLDQGLKGDERNVSLHILKVQVLEAAGRPGPAEEVLHKLVTLFPDNTDYRLLLASLYVNHKQPAKAEAEYRSVVAANPKTLAPKLQLVGFIAAARGPDAAAAELEKFAQAEPGSHEFKLELAKLRLQQNNGAAAVALWKDVIAGAGTAVAGTRARGLLASYQLALKDKASAQALIQEMIARDARDEQALLLRARIAVDERKLDEAITDLRNVLRDAPESASAHLLLASAHELQGAQELAGQHYARAAQAGRFAPAFALPHAEQLLRSGRTREAEGILREVLRVAPGHVTATRMLVQTYLKAGDIASAQALADEAAKSEAGEAAARQLQGTVQFARRDFDGGVASFRRAYELAPSDPQTLTTVVHSYRAAGKSKEALAFLQAVQAASPQNQFAQVLYGELLAQTGNIPAALKALNLVIQADPTNAAAHRTLIAVQLAARKPDEALAANEQALRAIPNDFSLRLTRAGLLEMQGRTEDAITTYEALLAERPNAAMVANNLASLLADNRKDAASLRRAYDIAQRFRGTSIPQLKDTIGWTTHLMGKHHEAADLLKSASAQAPQLAVVHYHYGMCQLALNNPQLAKEALQRSVDLAKTAPFPQAEDARKALQNL